MKIGPDDQLDEAISALIDGELDNESDKELRQQLIERICSDPSLKQRWTHYHLISDSLSNNLPEEIYCDLSDHVHSLIADEPVYSLAEMVGHGEETSSRVIDASQRFNRQSPATAPVLSRKQLMMKRAAGFAIAASVATVALVSYQIGLQQHMDENMLAQQSADAPSQPSQELASINPTQMATVNGVTVFASPVSNPANNLRPSNTGPGVYSPPGEFHEADQSRYFIGYNVLGAQNEAHPLQNPLTMHMPSQAPVEASHQLNDRESVLLRQYLMDHTQRYSSSHVQGDLPLARMMAVPTQSGALVSQSNQ